MKQRLITSALPYVNNVPHLGNLIQVLSADVFARFCRLKGYPTLYICGTDEYGTATETRAAEEGIHPRELCERYYRIHAGIYSWFNIAFDKFGRTSTEIQTEVTQHLFKKLEENGYIRERTIEQLYCPVCGRFLADRYVRGTCPHCNYGEARGDQCESCGKLLDPTELKDSRCASCGTKPDLRETKHLYIDLPALKDKLEAWIKDVSVRGEWANNAVQMTAAWIRDGLHERAITRDLKWGIPVPREGYENKVFYVWFDAPIGYISITGTLAQDRGTDWKSFVDSWWRNPDNTELFQFIGKDNIPFHTVIFPSTLLGSGEKWTMLHHMSSTEYLNYEGGKFSKSKGVGVFGTDIMETRIPADVWRFYIFYNRPERSDALFSWKDFQEKVNSELIGNLGNLVNRTLAFVTRYYDGKIPDINDANGEGETGFWNTVRGYEKQIIDKLEWAELRDAFHLLFELSSFANKTFQDAEPWKFRTEDPPKAAAAIRNLCYVVRDIGILAEPFLPQTASRILGFLGLAAQSGVNEKAGTGNYELLSKARGIETIRCEVLFTRLEDETIAALRERYSGSQKDREKSGQPNKSVPGQTEALFENTLDLRVAKITAIERHPNAEKLYIETLEILAPEERVIVSGLVPFYTEEELLGKHIIVAYNLKAAKLRGVVSRGMLLAASATVDGNEIVEVLDAGNVPAGTRVVLEGASAEAARAKTDEITIDQFFAAPLVVNDYTVYAGEKALTLNGTPLKTTRIKKGEVH
ncbi:MAG: methionine--tRNA ligase [Treponema sp.]|jgi:methionyl-tRNA synthetase|nr:methionine--tRNA ligase [Treponema sp.]